MGVDSARARDRGRGRGRGSSSSSSSFRGQRGRGGGPESRTRRNDWKNEAGGAVGRDADAGKKRKANAILEEEDPEAEIQRRLAKKLGIKGSAMKKDGDGLDDLLGEFDDIMMGAGMSSGSDDEDDHESDEDDRFDGGFDDLTERGERGESDGEYGAALGSPSSPPFSESDTDDSEDIYGRRKAANDSTGTTKYIPPALRHAQQEQNAKARGGADGDAESLAVLRKVRGLINRMTESNLEGIVTDLATMYRNEGRSYVSTSLSKELITGSTEGPRASERFAITAAAAVASLAGLTESSEVIATFLAMLGRQLESSLKDKDSLACSNLVRLLGCLYLSKAIKADLVFDVLDMWSDRNRGGFTEGHVVSIVGLLTVAGLALRKAEPSLMKEFVVDIHDKASRETDGDAESARLTTRARVMLDLVVDVKNNRMKDSDRKGVLANLSGTSAATLANALPPNVAQWFRGSISKIEAVAIGGIPWSKVVRADNKGFWWLQGIHDVGKTKKGAPTERETMDVIDVYDLNEVNGFIDPSDTSESKAHLLKLAKKLRMSTDTRRAIFLAVMSSEDAIDAAEKLLRLNLKGSQEREIVRVIVECCMHEPAWNPYYGLLLTRLCTLAKGHRVTLNYCLWDLIKDANGNDTAEGVGANGIGGGNKLKNGRQIAIFSRLCAHTVVSKALPLASLIKVSEFDACDMDTRELLMWKTFFKSVCGLPKTTDDVKDIFGRLADAKEHKSLKRNCREFLKYHVGPWLVEKGEDSAAVRCALAEKCLR